MSLHHIETEAVGRGRGRARRALATAVVSSFAIGALANVAATAAFAAPLSTIDIGGPTGSGMFGKKVLVLANGNFVVTDPLYDSPTATDVGAVYLYNGATHALISTLTGTQDFDQIGSKGVLEVGSSDLVVLSPSWSNDTEQAAGAVTWIDGTAGLDGEVSPSNSVVGVNTFDFVGTAATVLKNGNVVLTTQTWDNGNFADAGAVTLIDGASGAVGPVDATNSLVGSKNGDQIGLGGIVELTNGNFLVRSTLWDNGAAKDLSLIHI